MDLLALLIYPGLLWAFVLGVLHDSAAQRRFAVPHVRPALFGASADGILAAVSIVLAALALALLPWPLHPVAGGTWIGRLTLIWVAFEGAFLAPLLPALLSASPFVARAAIREAQIGAAGRVVIWLASGVAALGALGWELADLPARLLGATAAVMALPAVMGAGAFGMERSMTPGGPELGLDRETAVLARFARSVRSTAFVCVPIVLMLPPVAPPIGLGLALILIVGVVLGIRSRDGFSPRLTLPAALRWCWWRALPLALAALVYGLLRLL
jgi:hypothetical protein